MPLKKVLKIKKKKKVLKRARNERKSRRTLSLLLKAHLVIPMSEKAFRLTMWL